MDIKDFEKALSAGEGYHVEFKSWKEAGGQKACVKLAVPELIAFANADGGTVYLGVEDKTGEVTGCDDYDCQNIIEAIYDKTRPPLFVKAEEIDYKGKIIIGLSVENDGIRYTTTDGRCLRRLGKNSKPYYPEGMGNRYSRSQRADFSSRILSDSTVNDIDLLAVYDLKEKLSRRNPDSTLAQMEALPLLRDLQLLVDDNGVDRLNVAGLLFVGKESSIKALLPQMEVIYLKYDERNLEEYSARIDLRQPILKILDRLTEKVKDDNHIVNVQVGLFRLEIEDYSEAVFQEALLNALAHRDYESQGAVYVRRYPDKIVIENPGGFPEGISKYNIITHPSIPRNKLIAETLQHLKYVQRTGQGVDIIYKDMVLTGKPYPEYSVYNDAVKLVLHSQVEDFDFVRFITQEQDKNEQSLTLADLMIARHLIEHKSISLKEAEELTQLDETQTQKSLRTLVNFGYVEQNGKEYMLTAKVYDALKGDIEYVRDKVVTYIRAKEMIKEYLIKAGRINISTVQELCGFSHKQARAVLHKMQAEEIIVIGAKGKYAYYILKQGV